MIERCGDLLKEQTIKQMLILCEILISKNIPSVRIILLSLLRLVRPNFTDKKSVGLFRSLIGVAKDIRVDALALPAQPGVGGLSASVPELHLP